MNNDMFSSVQSLSRVRHFATPWITARQASLAITNSQSLLKLMSIDSVMPSKHFILCCPLPMNSKECHPSNEFSGLISFRIDWFDLLAVQGTLKSHLWHHSSKASILQHSAFIMGQLSYPYMATGKTIALTRWTSVGKVMSLLFNMLSRFVIAFLPRSKCLLISWLQSPSVVTLEPKEVKSVTVSIFSPSCFFTIGAS